MAWNDRIGRRRFAAILSLLLAVAPAFGAEKKEERERIPPSVLELRRLLAVDVPFADRVRDHYERILPALSLDASIEALKADPEKLARATAAAADLYRIAGFEAVHEALKRGGISKEGSKRIALVRNEMLSRACDQLAMKYGSVAINNFSLAESVKSDIDFTLFSRWHTPEYVVPKGPDGKTPDGFLLKQEFYKEYQKLWGIEAGRMEIAAHAGEAQVPDWRLAKDTEKFAVEYQAKVGALMANPEAYFLEAAYRMQVDRRTFTGRKKLFVVHTGNLRGDGADRREYHARETLYRNVPPEFRPGYAFGAAVGNFHFFRFHSGDPLHFSKYVLRSVEDGMRLLAMKEGDVLKEWKDWKDLDPAERSRILAEVYPAGSAIAADEVGRMLDKALVVRAHSDDYETAKWEIWKAEAEAIYREKGLTGEIPDEMREGLVKDAEARFEARSTELMIENCVRTAKVRAADFTDAGRMVDDMRRRNLLPDDVDWASQKKNLQLATLYEFYIAFQTMDETVRQRIIASSDGPAKAMLQQVDDAVKARLDLFNAPSHWKRGDPDFFKKVAQRWDTEVAKIKAAGYDVLFEYRAGGYDKDAIKARMRQWTLERIGYSFEKPLWQAEKLGEKLDGKFESKQLVGRIANLGNLDSLLTVIRTGQETGWDAKAVGGAVLFEAVANLPYAGPLMAAKGALFDGEFQGAAVMVGAYFWPVVGQIYLVGNIGWNAILILDHETKEGLVDMMIDGISPDEATGALNTIRRFWGVAWEEITRGEAKPAPFYSPLRPVPGANAEERRKNFFAHVDGILAGKLRAAGYEPLKWDDAKLRVIEAFMGRWIKEFQDCTGPFADDLVLKAFWESELSALQKSWLADAAFRQRLIDRLNRMYVMGLHKRALEEGQKARDQMETDALDLAARVAAFEDAMRAKVGRMTRYLGELTGSVDYADHPEKAPEIEEVEPEGKVTISVPPGTKLELGQRIIAQVDVEEVKGKFVKPFQYDWSFVGLTPAFSALSDDIGMLKVECGSQPVRSVRIRVVVRDSSGDSPETSRRVGEAEIEIGGAGIVDSSGSAAGVGDIYVVSVAVGTYSFAGKKVGEAADIQVYEWYTVRMATPRRPIEQILTETKEKIRERYRYANQISVAQHSGPFKTEPQVPAPRRYTKQGQGPARPAQ